jgi:hypothetical protein
VRLCKARWGRRACTLPQPMSHIEYPDVVQLDTRDMAGGRPMQTILSPSQVGRGGTEVHEEATPPCLSPEELRGWHEYATLD